PVNSFSGGDEANNYLKGKGFKIVNLHQNEISVDQIPTEEIIVRSWSKPVGIPNLIGRKKVDLSIFKYGSHVPLQFIDYFNEANGGYRLGRGESKDIVLLIDRYPYKAKLVNGDRKRYNKDSVQIRWVGNRELIELLIDRFDKTYKQMLEKDSSNLEMADEPNRDVINQDAYIDFIKTDIPFQYIMKTIIDGKEISPQVWWVNQGKNISQESSGGYIWAPLKSKNGGQIGHWDRLNEIRIGDLILHYSKGALRYVGRAISSATEALSPDQSIEDYSNKPGRLVKVEYHQLVPEIALQRISPQISKLSIPEGPLDSTGTVKQGYLFNFDYEGLIRIQNTQPETQWPDFAKRGFADLDYLEVIKPFNMDEKVSELVQTILSQGYTFEPWQIAAFVAALKTKPFVILAGVSGTGKSKLPSLIAEATGAEKLLIPVRPDWTDSSDVLGYCDLQGSFRPGSLLSYAKKAQENENKQFVCIMDEMNLARVEHYFAEVLSQIEDRHRCDNGGFASNALISQKLLNEHQIWAEQGLPAILLLLAQLTWMKVLMVSAVRFWIVLSPSSFLKLILVRGKEGLLMNLSHLLMPGRLQLGIHGR
ncbi:MAG: AAA family ATPase, partial [Syntrophomonadaceae bacterium]